jgi:hypothetical protein
MTPLTDPLLRRLPDGTVAGRADARSRKRLRHSATINYRERVTYLRSRRVSSASTALRMKSACGSLGASTALMRASVPSGNRAVIFSPGSLIRILPTERRIGATGNCVESCILLPPPIDRIVAPI